MMNASTEPIEIRAHASASSRPLPARVHNFTLSLKIRERISVLVHILVEYREIGLPDLDV